MLTSHLAPVLAVGDATQMPPDVVYLVKTQLNEISDITDAVLRAISGATETRDDHRRRGDRAHRRLRAMCCGCWPTAPSTRAIADARGTTVRAAETMLTRLYTALAIDTDDAINSRVAAVRLWQQGRVTVR